MSGDFGDWGTSAPDVVKRVVLALGPEPLDDARHLLAPVPLQIPATVQTVVAEAPDNATDFIIEASGQQAVSLLAVLETLTAETRAALRFPRVWGRTPESSWFPIPYLTPDALVDTDLPISAIAFSWALSQFVFEGPDAIREMNSYWHEIERRFAALGWAALLGETAGDAAARASCLNRIKARFARPVEMLLVPQGRSFPARLVWRSAYALGLTWGEMDLFHWHEPLSGRRLFTLSSLGQPGYFLPERAAEGEGVPGLSLGFELPTAPAPLETFDRMAVALTYLRHHLGGRPTTADGAELDAERLDTDRESLEEAVTQMTRSGISPGSPEAARYF